MFAATLGHVRPCCISIHCSSQHYSPETGRPRPVQKDDGIACVNTLQERSGIVPVHDPGVAFQHTPDGFRPFCFRRLDPAGFPIERVQVHNVDSKDLAQPACKRRLARPTGADYKNLSRRSQICYGFPAVKPTAAFPRTTFRSDPESVDAIPTAQKRARTARTIRRYRESSPFHSPACVP